MHLSIITAETTDLWDIEGKFSLKIVSAGNLNVSKDASVSKGIMLQYITSIYVPVCLCPH